MRGAEISCKLLLPLGTGAGGLSRVDCGSG